MDAIVNDYGSFQRSAQRTQILYVDAVSEGAVLTIQSVSEVLVVWVEDLNHCVRVLSTRGREEDNLKHLVHRF